MKQQSATKPVARNFNKPAYVILTVITIFYLAVKDYSQAAICFPLALAFDPFDTQMPFHKRPFFQKAWLYVHVSISLGLFVLLLLRK